MEWITPLLSLALLLAGMAMLTAGLQAGRGAERLFTRMRKDGLSAFLAGLLGTVLIQSSSASTVLIAGAYDTQRLGARETAAAIVGANIGTTLTGWLFCMGLGGSGWLPGALLCAALLVLLLLRRTMAALGAAGLLSILLALQVLSRMDASNQLVWLVDGGALRSFLRAVGLTAVLQSSSACVGFLQAASRAGTLHLAGALPLVLGCNIGTCTTALLASLLSGHGAKLAAVMHLAFNVLSALLVAGLYVLFDHWLPELLTPIGIAALHSLTNLLPALLVFPFLLRPKMRVADFGHLYYDKTTL